jgi:hypothetical protein
MELYTDASASKGFGGYYTGKWFSAAWSEDLPLVSDNVKLYLHAHQVNCLISFIITKHLDRPVLTIPTVASLSHQSKMFFHFQSLPHKIAEISIGYNSKIDFSTHVKELHHYLTLNKECRVDLQFWLTFLTHQVNCLISFIITKHLDRPFFTIPTVASLSHQNKMFSDNDAIDNVLSLTKGKSSDHADENHLPV